MSRGGRLLLLLHHHIVLDMLHLATHVLFERARLLLVHNWVAGLARAQTYSMCVVSCVGGGDFPNA